MLQDLGAQEAIPSYAAFVPARYQALIWACLDADLVKSAVFYAERYFSEDDTNHDARHLYATALFRCGQVHSAISLIDRANNRCGACWEIKAKCCTALGRHFHAREAIEESLNDSNYLASASTSVRGARVFPEEAVLHCRAGLTALKGNLHDSAVSSFRHALLLNPMLWEAFEGLCAVGDFPANDELFPPRAHPPNKGAEDSNGYSSTSKSTLPTAGPTATGVGFFTPDAPTNARSWRPDPAPPQPFRMGLPTGGRDSLATNDSYIHPDDSMPNMQLRGTRAQSSMAVASGSGTRPLSSADEAGPAMKKPRSTSRHAATDVDRLRLASTGVETRSKKLAVPSRGAKADSGTTNGPGTSRRGAGTRLLSGAGDRQTTRIVKHPPNRDRRRQPAHGRSKSTESELDDDYAAFGDVAYSPSPPSVAHSPRSEGSPAPTVWTAAQEQAAQEAYDISLADIHIYEIMRMFARAVRALAMHDCASCLEELDQLPQEHQRSSSVMAMVGRARYEMAEYMKAERFFDASRTLEPCRLWDMEVYSTTLWHLQKHVQLSFLAQELLSIDPRSSQAWIAVGNCFSLQKERSQALTCFRRAAQLDPSCAYAYTLSGHELTDDDLDKAISFFQSALRADPRHYNAWYGLGTCYLRMSKIRLAEYHFRKAAAIHPSNAVLLGCVGMAVERRGDQREAFELFNQAVRLSQDNALVRYRRAKILIAMKDYRAAVEDLERLRDSSPEEANIVFQLARVYRLLGDETKSAQMLAIVRDMSPKSLNKIKRLLETTKESTAEDGMEEG